MNQLKGSRLAGDKKRMLGNTEKNIANPAISGKSRGTREQKEDLADCGTAPRGTIAVTETPEH